MASTVGSSSSTSSTTGHTPHLRKQSITSLAKGSQCSSRCCAQSLVTPFLRAPLASFSPNLTSLSASPSRTSLMPPLSSWLCSTVRAACTAGWVCHMASSA